MEIHKKIYDLKWQNLLKDRVDPYWWKDERKLFEMVCSCSKEKVMHLWERVSLFKLRERKKIEEDQK